MQKIIKYINQIIYWLIILIPLSIAIAPAITHTFIGIMVFLFLAKKAIIKEKLFMRTAVNAPYIILLLVVLVSIKNSINYSDSLLGLIKFVRNAFVFLICAEEIKDISHIKRIVLFIILGATLASVDALWQLGFGKDFIRGRELIINIGLKRVTAAFPNANVLGIYLSAISPLIIGLTLYFYKGRIKFIMCITSILVTTALIFTFSRGAA